MFVQKLFTPFRIEYGVHDDPEVVLAVNCIVRRVERKQPMSQRI